jgi:hypothetical protein
LAVAANVHLDVAMGPRLEKVSVRRQWPPVGAMTMSR